MTRAVAPVVTGISPIEGVPGTKVTIRGENLGSRPEDLIGNAHLLCLPTWFTHLTYSPSLFILLIYCQPLFTYAPQLIPVVLHAL